MGNINTSFIFSIFILFVASLGGAAIIRFLIVLPVAFRQAHQMDRYHKWGYYVFDCFKKCHDDLAILQDSWNAIIKSRGISDTDMIVLQAAFDCVDGLLHESVAKLKKTRNTKDIMAIAGVDDLNAVTHKYFDYEIESVTYMLDAIKWGLTEVNEKHKPGIIYDDEKRNLMHKEIMAISEKTKEKTKNKKEDKVV